MSEEMSPNPIVDARMLDLGYKQARNCARQLFGPYLWMMGNLTGHSRRGMDAFLGHVTQISSFLDLMSSNGLSIEAWQNYRGELSRVLRKGSHISERRELLALADTVQRFSIPHQFVFDPLNAADTWIRTQQFETNDQFESFTSRLGGSSLAAIFSILEFDEDPKRWQVRAIEGGQAIFQTLLLANFVRDLFQGKVFHSQADLDACKVDLDVVRTGETDKSFRHFCRVRVAKIETQLQGLGRMVHSFELDGERAMTSMLAYICRLLTRIKSDPSCLFDATGPVPRKDLMILRVKHLMGMEGNVSVIPEKHHH